MSDASSGAGKMPQDDKTDKTSVGSDEEICRYVFVLFYSSVIWKLLEYVTGREKGPGTLLSPPAIAQDLCGSCISDVSSSGSKARTFVVVNCVNSNL